MYRYILYPSIFIAVLALSFLVLGVYSRFAFIPQTHKKLKNCAQKLPTEINPNGRTVTFYGMCRNAMSNLATTKANIISLSRFFSDYRVIILEDGSQDGTREFIEKWRQEDDRVTIVDGDTEEAQRAVDMFSSVVPKSDYWKGPKRIARYASLRNQLHSAIKNSVLDSTFEPSCFVCMDMDQNVTIDEKGFYDSLLKMEEDSNVVACTAYGKTAKPWQIPLTTYLYDSYAFLDEWLIHNNADRMDKVKPKHIWYEKIDVKNKKFHQVVSNFGGLSIYKNTQEFMNNFYAVENIYNNRCDCEHVGFHKRLQAGNPQSKLLIGFETFFDSQ